jgi:hypothetical protein
MGFVVLIDLPACYPSTPHMQNLTCPLHAHRPLKVALCTGNLLVVQPCITPHDKNRPPPTAPPAHLPAGPALDLLELHASLPPSQFGAPCAHVAMREPSQAACASLCEEPSELMLPPSVATAMAIAAAAGWRRGQPGPLPLGCQAGGGAVEALLEAKV